VFVRLSKTYYSNSNAYWTRKSFYPSLLMALVLPLDKTLRSPFLDFFIVEVGAYDVPAISMVLFIFIV